MTYVDPSRFAHLHVHSEFSLLDGFGSVADIAGSVAGMGQRHVALTDHGNMFGAIKFWLACTKAGVHPILGCELYMAVNDTVAQDRERKQGSNHHLIVLVQNERGYQNLNRIITEANSSGFYVKPRTEKKFLAAHSEGLICLSGCLGSEIPQLLMGGDFSRAIDSSRWFKDVFGDRYYLEVQNHGNRQQDGVNESILEISDLIDIPIVATNDAHYIKKDDSILHQIMLAIQTRSRWDDPKRWVFPGDPNAYYIKSHGQMQLAFPSSPEFMTRTIDIAERCEFVLDMATKQSFPMPVNVLPGETEKQCMLRLIEEGSRLRLDAAYGEAAPKQLRHELNIIEKTGYMRYFLIVADVCRWAKDNGIRSSARGSVAGSLVAYVLGIAPVNPLQYNLSFERFLNMGRTPDIDLDFADDRRADVLNYVARAYGEDRVAQIVTFSQLHGRSAVRDVGRVFNVDAKVVSDVTQMIGIGQTIAEASKANPVLTAMAEREGWLRHALKIEGAIRHSSTHAAGVVIAGGPLIEKTTLIRNPHGGLPVVGVEMGDAEKIGLVKFDFLGLKTLSLVDRVVRTIWETNNVSIATDYIRDGDSGTYELLGRGDTVGVFQLESAGMRKYLIDLQPSTIDHLQAMVALYRPGPLAEISKYIRRKHGHEKVSYPHQIFEPILKDTYGVFVYQESIMEMAQQIMGLSPYESDLFLYAIRKKNPKTLQKYEPAFRAACIEQGVPSDVVDSVWDALLPFGDYGFNKAHAACYGQLAYVTAWLKSRYPKEFYSSLMHIDAGDSDRLPIIMADARRHGISIVSPCVNLSDLSFAVDDDGVRFGLSSIKFVGELAAQHIIERRGGIGFSSVRDFISRVDKSRVNSRAIKNLVFSGALSFAGGVNDILHELGDFTNRGPEALLDCEREALGMIISNPSAPMIRLDRAGRTHLVFEVLQRHEDGMDEDVCVGGRLVEFKRAMTKTGKQMAHVTIEDETGAIRGAMFSDPVQGIPAEAKVGALVVANGKVRSYLGNTNLTIGRLRVVSVESSHTLLGRQRGKETR